MFHYIKQTFTEPLLLVVILKYPQTKLLLWRQIAPVLPLWLLLNTLLGENTINAVWANNLISPVSSGLSPKARGRGNKTWNMTCTGLWDLPLLALWVDPLSDKPWHWYLGRVDKVNYLEPPKALVQFLGRRHKTKFVSMYEHQIAITSAIKQQKICLL